MEVEDFNALMELAVLNKECYNRAIKELNNAGKEVTPKAITELFEKYEQEYSVKKKLKELGFDSAPKLDRQM